MGYLDGIVDGGFKTRDDGVMLFYPFGIFGKGYIVPSLEKKQEIRKRLKQFNLFWLAAVIVPWSLGFPFIKSHLVAWWLGGLIYFVILAGAWLAGRAITKQLINGLTPVDQKITLGEVYQNAAKSHDLTVLGILALGSVLFVIFGISIIFESSLAWYLRLIGAISIIFFGFGGAVIGYMIKVKTKG